MSRAICPPVTIAFYAGSGHFWLNDMVNCGVSKMFVGC
jgi:hypothetical protein